MKRGAAAQVAVERLERSVGPDHPENPKRPANWQLLLPKIASLPRSFFLKVCRLFLPHPVIYSGAFPDGDANEKEFRYAKKSLRVWFLLGRGNRRERRECLCDTTSRVREHNDRSGAVCRFLMSVTTLFPIKANSGCRPKRLKGKSDGYFLTNVWQPGGTTGWHTHPGHTLIVVTAGTITHYDGDDPNCTPHVYTVGMTFVDRGGTHVHIVRKRRRR